MSELGQKLMKYGIDYDEGVERTDDADFYKKLALKYLENTHYVDLVAAMEVKDFDEGYKAAHALKGVAGNLSLTDLYKSAGTVSSALYSGEYQTAEQFMPQVEKDNKAVLDGLEKWANDEL